MHFRCIAIPNNFSHYPHAVCSLTNDKAPCYTGPSSPVGTSSIYVQIPALQHISLKHTHSHFVSQYAVQTSHSYKKLLRATWAPTVDVL
jgi:hypothetical protein